MTKKDIERIENNQFWTTIITILILGCVWLMLFFVVYEQRQGTWECVEWEEDTNFKIFDSELVAEHCEITICECAKPDSEFVKKNQGHKCLALCYSCDTNMLIEKYVRGDCIKEQLKREVNRG